MAVLREWIGMMGENVFFAKTLDISHVDDGLMVKRSNTLKMVKQATGSLPSRSAKGKPNCQVT